MFHRMLRPKLIARQFSPIPVPPSEMTRLESAVDEQFGKPSWGTKFIANNHGPGDILFLQKQCPYWEYAAHLPYAPCFKAHNKRIDLLQQFDFNVHSDVKPVIPWISIDPPIGYWTFTLMPSENHAFDALTLSAFKWTPEGHIISGTKQLDLHNDTNAIHFKFNITASEYTIGEMQEDKDLIVIINGQLDLFAMHCGRKIDELVTY